MFIYISGIMMIAAWILCASIGVVVARYYKPVWLEEKLLGEKVWFTVMQAIYKKYYIYKSMGKLLHIMYILKSVY
jgi:hypothetical protein